MALIIVLLFVVGATAAGYLHGRWQKRSDVVAVPRRLPRDRVWRFARYQVALVVILVAGYFYGDWDADSVGFSQQRHWLEPIVVGEAAFLGLALSFAGVLYLGGLVIQMRAAANRANLSIWPRRRSEKWIMGISVIVLNPFTEELVMRGVLIHQWGLALGSPVIPIIVGAVLNAVLHLYQGWRMQVWHAMFFATAVALLYSPWGLAAAITAHWFGDFVPIAKLRRGLKAERRARSRARIVRTA